MKNIESDDVCAVPAGLFGGTLGHYELTEVVGYVE